jgi:hypothetical protein
MKTLFFLTFCLAFGAFAQTPDSTKTRVAQQTSEEVEKTPSWEKSISFGLNLSHTLNVNAPTSAPKEGFSTTDAIDAEASYVKEGSRLKFKNEFHWSFSFFKANGSTPMQNTTDALTTFQDLSYSLRKNGKWNVNVVLQTETPIFTQYEGSYLKDYDQLGEIQRFLNPYSFNISPGLKFQPNKDFGISISPYAIKLFGLTDQKIADKGQWITDQNIDGHYKLQNTTRLGAQIVLKFTKKIKKKIILDYGLNLSSNYFENILKNGNMSGQFITKFNLFNGFWISHRATLKGNFADNPFKPYYSQVILLAYTLAL